MIQKSKVLAVDCRIDKESKYKLLSLGYELIEIPEFDFFDKPVSAHPDMSILNINGKIFSYSGVHILDANFDLTYVNKKCAYGKLRYPQDVSLNCAVVGKHLICNKKSTDKTVLEYAHSIGMSVIDVNQGYAKCSTCVINENAIITEDTGIALQANKNGIDTLLIEKGYVKLDGYNYGFIGGASGLIDDGLIAFNGNIELHPDANKVIDFCNKHSVAILNLNNRQLYDVGSIIRL